MIQIKNEILTASIDIRGAQLRSVKGNGKEYMWQGDPEFREKTAPVLFPFVGSCPDGKYTVYGKEYTMPQHGFARDMDFEVSEINENSVLFTLCENDESLQIYPFRFTFTAEYSLVGSTMKIKHNVTNTDSKKMYFFIGGHPGFNLLDKENYFTFNTDKDIIYYQPKISEKDDPTKPFLLKNTGFIPIDEKAFFHGSYRIMDKQVTEVSLCGRDKKPYITVRFDSPLFLLWRSPGGKAPFLCIEPWYGRPYTGTLPAPEIEHWDHINALAPSEQFTFRYTIRFN